jgi:hypothetical protein
MDKIWKINYNGKGESTSAEATVDRLKSLMSFTQLLDKYTQKMMKSS